MSIVLMKYITVPYDSQSTKANTLSFICSSSELGTYRSIVGYSAIDHIELWGFVLYLHEYVSL